MSDARIMPSRLFIGSAGNQLLSTLTTPHGPSSRKLAPGEHFLGDFIVPAFQRPLVWTLEQKVRLIESLYIGLPIGALVYNMTVTENPCDLWLLDGQQRLDTILRYVNGEFPVLGWRFTALPKTEKNHFYRINVPLIETCIDTPDMCRDVYDRLVYGGTPHTL